MVSVKLSHPGDVTSAKYTPVDKAGKAVEQPKTQEVHGNKPIEVVFDKPVKADHIIIN
jgi:hypothetical protein